MPGSYVDAVEVGGVEGHDSLDVGVGDSFERPGEVVVVAGVEAGGVGEVGLEHE